MRRARVQTAGRSPIVAVYTPARRYAKAQGQHFRTLWCSWLRTLSRTYWHCRSQCHIDLAMPKSLWLHADGGRIYRMHLKERHACDILAKLSWPATFHFDFLHAEPGSLLPKSTVITSPLLPCIVSLDSAITSLVSSTPVAQHAFPSSLCYASSIAETKGRSQCPGRRRGRTRFEVVQATSSLICLYTMQKAQIKGKKLPNTFFAAGERD